VPEVIFASTIPPNKWQLTQAAKHFDSDRLWVLEVEAVVPGEGVIDSRFYVVLANNVEEAQQFIESNPDVRRSVGGGDYRMNVDQIQSVADLLPVM
jgi:hypothetical protein